MKLCNTCLIHKNKSLFLIDKRYCDGIFPICISCLPHNKTCSKCGESLDKSFFNKEKKNKDGLTSCCKSCRAINSKKFRETNIEAVRKYKRDYAKSNVSQIKLSRQRHYKNNKQIILNKNKDWQRNHPQVRKAITRTYYLKNKLYYKLKCAERNARKQKLTIQKFSTQEFEQRMSVFGNKCFYCGGAFEHVDHAIPLIRHGYHCLANLRPACKSCNLRKGTKTSSEFIIQNKKSL